ncbi:MAG: DUF4038 domain-containing protein [Anaerolineae bacterium]|nr:DUF4038 domain-containing protein [Anaerolineae bacterium]
MQRVGIWRVAELTLEADRRHSNPLYDVVVEARLRGPGGRERRVEGFWDGGKTWRVRFAPDAAGEWHYDIVCRKGADPGLDGRSGVVQCVAGEPDAALFRYGPVAVSPDGRHLIHADGTPFFWLADAAWNGVLKAKLSDWKAYLRTRREQGFTAVMFVLTHWRAFLGDALGERAYTGAGPIQVNPGFFARLDAKVEAVNREGLLAAPVLLWAIAAPDDRNPGYSLPEDDAVALARYMVARYGAYQVAWLLGGDGDYEGEKAERWRRIGRRVFGDGHDRPVTMHPRGVQWVGVEFRREEWFDFIGYQSGHGDSRDHLAWLTQGPPATDWDTPPVRPVINLEPNYEYHVSYHSRQRFTDYHVRRALYWSLLVSPTAGVTYGHHGVWPWMEEHAVPPDHPSSGEAPPWHEALHSPGSISVRHLRSFFNGIEWWRLRPAPELLLAQPGGHDPAEFVAVGATAERDLVVAYLPRAGEIGLAGREMPEAFQARWYDPAEGTWAEAVDLGEGWLRFRAAGERDRVLLLEGV